jgi:hypothetical protein
MKKNIKPIPKSQKEISREIPNPYDDRGNPNFSPNPNEIQTGINFNRSEQLSFKDDNNKQLNIGLKELDEAVFYYFENIIKPFVYQNNERILVPIIYNNSENWKSFQRDASYRDKNGTVMSPIIVIKRDSFNKDRTVYNKLDANSPNLYQGIQKSYNKKNPYNNFNILNNQQPVIQHYLSVVPDFITVTYSCLIQTYYVEQLNKIIESIEYASDSYWGDPEKFKFRAFIDSFTMSVLSPDNKDRIAKGTFNIKLRGYIVPDTIQKDLNSLKKVNSKSKITITKEIVSNLNIK